MIVENEFIRWVMRGGFPISAYIMNGSVRWSWSLASFFDEGQSGFWAGGFNPPEFSPELLLAIGQSGFWANIQEAQQ